MEKHVRSEDHQKRCNSSLTTALNTLLYVRSTIFFCKLLFSWIDFNDFIFYLQETYNSRLRERYGNDPSTHLNFDPDLWMEARSSGGPHRNRVYELSNTTVENLQTACSVSIVGSSQSISSTQSRELAALQEHTADVNEKYERLSTDYEELRRMVMDMRSQMGGICALLFWPYGSRNDQPPPPLPAPPLL
jgi:hypothetical protein